MRERDLLDIIKKQNEEIVKLKKDYHNIETVVQALDEDVDFISKHLEQIIKK